MSLDNINSLTGAQTHQHYHTHDHNALASNSHDQVQQLCAQHGAQNVACAGHNIFISNCCNGIRQGISSQSCPQGIKDEQMLGLNDLEQSCMMSSTPDCSEAVSNSSMGQDAAAEGAQAGGSSGAHHVDNGAHSNSGSHGASGATGSNGLDGYSNASNQSAESHKDDESKSKSKNFLVAMAEALAKIQLKFINQAMEDLDKMNAMSKSITQQDSSADRTPQPPGSNATQAQKDEYADKLQKYETKQNEEKKKEEGERREFLLAQSRYQANMQMFNMMANMTATSLKSLGEGMTTLARKQ